MNEDGFVKWITSPESPIPAGTEWADKRIVEFRRAYNAGVAANPSAVLALISENKALKLQTELQYQHDTTEINALRARIEELEKQEPVAWFDRAYGDIDGVEWNSQKPKAEGNWKPLFTRPMPAQDVEHCLWARNGHEPCQHVKHKPAQDVNAEPSQRQPNNDEVICPNCTHQFRAIPVNVQHMMIDGGIKPPFFTKDTL